MEEMLSRINTLESENKNLKEEIANKKKSFEKNSEIYSLIKGTVAINIFVGILVVIF